MTGINAALFPQILDKYIVKELVGSGSFANVYKAIPKGSHTTVAIKAYKLKYWVPEERLRAAYEMAFVNMLKHVNIIRFVACDTARSCMYLITEFAFKGNLLRYLPSKEKLNSDQLQVVIRQLLSALHYLHSLSILHGDIKPENILVTNTYPEMVIKLTDFGLAEIVNNRPLINKTSGSFFYMAPEMHFNFPCDLTCDLYSAGVVIYELIYDQKPFMTNRRSEYIYNLRKRLPPAFPLIEGISAECLDLLKSLLHYDKHSRPTGQKLIGHSYLKLASHYYPKVDHYITACTNFVKSCSFLKAENVGRAYIEAVQGIMQLKLYSNHVIHDCGMFQYLEQLISKYSDYIRKLDRKLTSGQCIQDNVDLLVIDEKIRCLLIYSPVLLKAFDMCLLGNMYINQHELDIGSDLLKNGVSKILECMAAEPDGEAKRELKIKVTTWLDILERVKADGYSLRPIISTSASRQ